jgi:hypothetical protein
LKSRQAAEDNGYVRHIPWANLMVGRAEVRLGNLEDAHRKFIESIASFEKYGHKMGFVITAEAFAELAVALSLPQPAAVLIAWSDSQRAIIGNPRPKPEQDMIESVWVEIRKSLSAQEIADVKAAGEKMRYDEAMEFALQEIKP